MSRLLDVTAVSGAGPLRLLGASTLGVGMTAGKVGIGTAAPTVELDVSSTDALVLPTGTVAQRPASPASGDIRLNSDADWTEGYNGTDWVRLGMAAASANTATLLADQALSGNTVDVTVTGYHVVFYKVMGATTGNNRNFEVRLLSGGTNQQASNYYTCRVADTSSRFRSYANGANTPVYIAQTGVSDSRQPVYAWGVIHLPASTRRPGHSFLSFRVSCTSINTGGVMAGWICASFLTTNLIDTVRLTRSGGGGNFTAGRIKVWGISLE